VGHVHASRTRRVISWKKGAPVPESRFDKEIGDRLTRAMELPQFGLREEGFTNDGEK